MTEDWSLGEVQSLVTKAAKGAVRSFGLADEAGYAARWLAERGFDGAGALAALLEATDGAEAARLAPDPSTLEPVGAVLCPLHLGTYLADTADTPPWTLGAGTFWPVLMPLVLAPFAAQISGVTGPVRLNYGSSGGLVMNADGAVWGKISPGPPVGLARLAPTAVPDTPPLPPQTRARVTQAASATLHRLAHRTYAPATQTSRSGAGAGLTDND